MINGKIKIFQRLTCKLTQTSKGAPLSLCAIICWLFEPLGQKYFLDTDTAHIEFTDKEVQETKEISENIYIDVDAKHNIVYMTIEHAKIMPGSGNSHIRKCPGKQHRNAKQ